MQQQLTFGSRKLVYHLRFTERKTLGIQIHPSGQVAVAAPLATNTIEIKAKVRQKAPWIFKQLDQFSKYRSKTPPRRFINGETHLYLGRQYRLKIVKDVQNSIKVYRGQLWIHSNRLNPESTQKQLNLWYKQRAKDIFEQMLDIIFPRFKRYKIHRPSLILRKMSKRWGSCTPGGKIILNTELIKAPKGSIEYLIIHELCHLVHYNHKKSFYNLQEKIMPDWKKWKERLETSLI